MSDPPSTAVERLSSASLRAECETVIEAVNGYVARALGGVDERLALPPGAAASLERTGTSRRAPTPRVRVASTS